MTTLTPAELQALSPEFLAQDKSETLMIVSIAFIIIQTVVFAGYVAARVIKGDTIGWVARLLVPASYLNVLALSIMGILFVEVAGVGRHVEYHLINNPIAVKRYLQIQTACEFIYMAGITLPRLIICDFYLKIFQDRKVRWITWAVSVILVLYFLSGIILALTICHPFAYKWDKTIDGHCTNFMGGYRFISVPGIATDVAILVLPFSTVWRLQVSHAKRFAIFVTFLIGSLGIIGSTVRMIEFFKLDLESDPTYLAVETMTWTIVEPSAYFICACLPCMFPLLKFVVQKASQVKSSRKASADSETTQPVRRTPVPDMKRLSLRLSRDEHEFDRLDVATYNVKPFVREREYSYGAESSGGDTLGDSDGVGVTYFSK